MRITEGQPMNDVREQLAAVYRGVLWGDGASKHDPNNGHYLDVADAILARFEVTAKPAVTARSLGELMHKALERSDVRPGWAGVDVQGLNFDSVAVKVLDQLAAAGLTIVRVDDGD